MFDEDRYFDVLVEYAKASPEDILVRITASNRGPEAAELHRAADRLVQRSLVAESEVPAGRRCAAIDAAGVVMCEHPDLGVRFLHADGTPRWLFTENSTNTERFGLTADGIPYFKDGINRYRG